MVKDLKLTIREFLVAYVWKSDARKNEKRHRRQFVKDSKKRFWTVKLVRIKGLGNQKFEIVAWITWLTKKIKWIYFESKILRNRKIKCSHWIKNVTYWKRSHWIKIKIKWQRQRIKRATKRKLSVKNLKLRVNI